MSTKDVSWFHQANCKNEDISNFFPLRYNASTVSYAFSCCKDCLVKEECLYQAMVTQSIGIWAGTTEHQRSNLLYKIFKNKIQNITMKIIKEIIQNNYYLQPITLEGNHDKPTICK